MKIIEALSKEALQLEYITNNHTALECSKIFNCTIDKVYFYLKKYAIKKDKEKLAESHSAAQKNRKNIKNKTTDLMNKIDRNTFYDYFISKNLNVDDCCSAWDISKSDFHRIQKEYNILKDQKSARACGLKTLNTPAYEEFKKSISIDNIKKYYVTENHTELETMLYFKISEAFWNKLRIDFKLQKPKKAQVINCLKSKNLENIDEILARIDQKEFTEDYTQLCGYEILDKYSINTYNLYQLLDKYNIDRKANTSADSRINIDFKNILEKNNINYSREYFIYYNLPLRNYYKYDFLVDKTLIEIDPTVTHSTSFSYKGSVVDKDYHKNKSKIAHEKEFDCIHVFDWDDMQKVASLFIPKTKISARKCLLKLVDRYEAKKFLDANHLQNSCNGISISYGLYYNDELIQIMSFGKPRYNKNYDFELLRLCSKIGYEIIGGSEKIFKHFIQDYSGSSIISYCDKSKFTGNVYLKLGFKLLSSGEPSRHWYNCRLKKHLTDNLVRQRGFDQLFGTAYGKDYSNEELLIKHDFIDIYDCGQDTYIWDV